MKKKSFSLQKLPEIYKLKKQKIVEKNDEFQEKFRPIEKLEIHNQLMMFKLKSYDTTRSIGRQSTRKEEERASKIIALLTKHQKLVGDLQPIKENEFRTTQPRKLLKSSSIIKVSAKKMDVDSYIKEKNDKLIQQDLKKIQIENHRRQFLPSIIQSQKKLLPFYNKIQKNYEQIPFTKLEQQKQKVKVRFLNGFEKWINKAQLKQVQQNQPLTLQSYRKLIKKEPQRQKSQEQQVKRKEIIEKINIDSVFLQKMLNQMFNKKNPRPQIRKLLKEQLYGNYQDSVKAFNMMFVQQKQIKHINRFEKKNSVSLQLKNKINDELLCSYNLQFLGLYMLSKNNYISLMVESYNIIRQLKNFNHFTLLYKLNNTSLFRSSAELSAELNKYFAERWSKIESIIFTLEEHLNLMLSIIRKDIEHVIFLNPRLVGTEYDKNLKIFITSFSEHLSKIIRSAIICSINQQLTYLVQFYQQFIKVEKRSIWSREEPRTSFYADVHSKNHLLQCQFIGEKIQHGPGIIPVALLLKKWKKKKYSNIYRFIIESRQNIRQFSLQNWSSYKGSQERIIYKQPHELLQNIVINPLKDYFKQLDESQNVNGCIFNKNINLISFLETQKFINKMKVIYNYEKEQIIKMYVTYFQLWEHYYMEKPYIDDFIYLYKKINTIKHIQEEMNCLKDDLALIQSFPNIIELHLIRLDISAIKEKIQSTIQIFIKKLLKVSEQSISKMLEYGSQQTAKAKKLSEVTPYSNLAEYIEFVSFLNRRQVEKSVKTIAESVVFIDLNYIFLTNNNFDIKPAMLQRYLECGTWIRQIRMAAKQNKKKMSVDPYTFLKGVKDKKTKIFTKYNNILKEIVQMLKVSELKNAIKLSVLSQNIAQQMKEICNLADQIGREEKLLELEYYPSDESLISQDKIYRSDLTFFYKEYQFLKKYLRFWAYVTKLKAILENITQRPVVSFDGVQFVRLLREGQQLLSSIKLSTLNKRFLQLCDQVNRQIDPYLKCSKLFLVIVSGSQHYRLKVLKQITRQSSSDDIQKDLISIKIKELLSLQWQSFDWPQIYRIRENDKLFEEISTKLNSIYLVVKNLDVKLHSLQGVGDMKNYEILKVDEEIINILKYCVQVVKIIDEKQGEVFRKMDSDDEILSETVKKINIFCRAVNKMKTCYQKIIKYYSLFELLCQNLYVHFEGISLGLYLPIYQSIMLDYNKKTDLVKKLSYTTLYDDKIRVSYDDELKKMEQFEIKMYNEVIDRFLVKSNYFSNSCLEKENIFECFCHLALPDFNLYAVKLFGGWCTRVKFQIVQGEVYYIALTQIQTIYKQIIKVNFEQKLIDVKKNIVNGEQTTQITCGLLKIVENVQLSMKQKIQEQTKMILKLIYSFHYSTKNIFLLYLFVNNILLQPILNAMMISFYIDLGMLWQNKYDLNLLSQLIEESKNYSPKEKENQLYVDIIVNMLQQFISIIDLFQEREYCLEDLDKGRVKKSYAYNSIAKIVLHHFKDEQNKLWLNHLKQQKQDDFITNTHLNPALAHFNLLQLDLAKIQVRQIEKKDIIQNLFDSQFAITHLLMNESDGARLQKFANAKMKVNVISNLAPQYKFKEYSFSFGYQIVNECRYQHYSAETFRVTALLIQSRSLSKILVTNIHPNYQFLGCNFNKINKYIPNYNSNLAIVVYSAKELLEMVKQMKDNQATQTPSFIYIYYDRLNYDQIRTEDVEELCIVYEMPRKLHVNTLLKKTINYSQQQVFDIFMQSDSEVVKCYPFNDGHQKFITMGMLQNVFDPKQRQLAVSYMQLYQKSQGNYPNISQVQLAMLYHPVFMLTKTHYLENHFYEMAAHVYMKARTEQNSIEDVITSDLVGAVMTMNYEHHLAYYKIPIHNIVQSELFTQVKTKQYETVTQDKFKKDVQHVKVSKKPYFEAGYIEQLLNFSIGKNEMSSRLQKFRIKGEAIAKVKWFIVDLSVYSPQGRKVYDYFLQSFASNEYVLYNEEHIPTQLHYQQKMLKNHTHKIILHINDKYLQNYTKDLPPIPILNEYPVFQPMSEFKLALKRIRSFPQNFTQLINFTYLFEVFHRCMNSVKEEWLTVESMSYFNNLLFICANELRKREICVGHYCQQELNYEESKQNLLGSIDLREKTKLTHQQALQIQQIEKKMDTIRRQIYKCYVQNNKYEQFLTQQIEINLNKEYEIMNPPLHSVTEINHIMSSLVIFAFYYSIALPNPSVREQLSRYLQQISGQPELYMYCYSITSKAWQRWQQIDSELYHQSCNPSQSTKVLSAKQIIRLNKAKQRLTALNDLIYDMRKIRGKQHKIINLKGAEMYFCKLMVLYEMVFHIYIPNESYPRWAFEYQFERLTQTYNEINQALRAVPDTHNKKLHRFLLQSKLNNKYVRAIIIEPNDNTCMYKQQINYKMASNGSDWYKTSNSTIFFITLTNQNNIPTRQSEASHRIQVQIDKITLSPYRLLTNIHTANRFNDLQTSFTNVLISLKTYQSRIDYEQHYRFREYGFKGLDNQEKMEIFGIQMQVRSQEIYSEYRKKMKETLYKIKMQEAESKEQFTAEQLQKLDSFDRYVQINTNLKRLTSCVKVARKEITSNYALRYMLKKPKKYEKIESEEAAIKKKKARSPIRSEFDDMLIYTEAYDRSNLLNQSLNQLMIFFTLREKVLLIKSKQEYSKTTQQKCVAAYKYYRLAVQTMLGNKHSKPFALELGRLAQIELNIKQLGIYNLDSFVELRAQFEVEGDKDKLVFLKLYNHSIFSQVVELLNTHITMKIQAKKHHYILFAMDTQQSMSHGFRFVVSDQLVGEGNVSLGSILQQKQHNLQSKLQEYITRRAKKLILQSEIGTQYIVKATDKLSQVKQFTTSTRTQLDSKKEIVDKSKSEIEASQKNIIESKQSIVDNEEQIKSTQNQLYFWKLKKQFYGGDRLLREISQKFRELNRKKIEKEVNNSEYLQENSFNISYIYIFNILADNSYFPDKSASLLEQEYQLHKNYQLPDDQKRQFQKLINYGRLNALIDNDELVFENTLITEDQLLMCDKVRQKFIYLRQSHELIFQNHKYSQEYPFDLSLIFAHQAQMINKKGDSQLSTQFNLYLMYLFGHKYLQTMTAKMVNELQLQLKRSKELILKLKEKIQNEEVKLSASVGYLSQIKLKYESNARELQVCSRNQSVFADTTTSNITRIANVFLRFCFGLDINYHFDILQHYEIENKKNRTAKNKKDKKKKKIEDNQQLVQEQKEEKVEGQIKEISTKQSIKTLTNYIIEQLPKRQRRKLNDKECQLILSLLPTQAILELINTHNVQTVDEMYQACVLSMLKQMFGNEVIVFDGSGQVFGKQIQAKIDERKYNVIDLTKQYRSNTHYLAKQIDALYTGQIGGLVNRITTKIGIVNSNIQKLTDKIEFVQSKSSQSIGKFKLAQQVLGNIEEAIVNALKLLTNTAVENMFYYGEWNTKNRQKWHYYGRITQRIQQHVQEQYTQRCCAPIVEYYLRLVGMMGRKIDLEYLDDIMTQLFYDHSPVKNNSQKEVIEDTILRQLNTQQKQQKISQSQQSQPSLSQQSLQSVVLAQPQSAQKVQKLRKTQISTLDGILSTPCRLILVHGDSKCVNILYKKSYRQNKILKRIENIEFVIEENKSKEYWLVATVKPNMKLEGIIQKIVQLKQTIQLSQQHHMKFIILFQGLSWTEEEFSRIEKEVQPVYRFYYYNSAASVYYHTYHLIRRSLSTVTKNTEIQAVFNILRYYCPNLKHIPFYHVDFSELQHSRIIELIQNLFQLDEVAGESTVCRIFCLLVHLFKEIKMELTEALIQAQKEHNGNVTLHKQCEFYEQIKNSYQKENISRETNKFMKLVNQSRISLIHSQNSKTSQSQKIALAQLMKMGTIQDQKLEHIDHALSDPYKFLNTYRAFIKIIAKLKQQRKKKNKAATANQLSPTIQHATEERLFEVTNKYQLLSEIFQESARFGARINIFLVELNKKEKNRSIGIQLKIIGTEQIWLKELFQEELYLNIINKKYKNPNELSYVKGVFFRYNESPIFVKKETVNEVGEETTVTKPLPQCKCILPVYTDNLEYLGVLQATTNQLIQNQSRIYLMIRHNQQKLIN